MLSFELDTLIVSSFYFLLTHCGFHFPRIGLNLVLGIFVIFNRNNIGSDKTLSNRGGG